MEVPPCNRTRQREGTDGPVMQLPIAESDSSGQNTPCCPTLGMVPRVLRRHWSGRVVNEAAVPPPYQGSSTLPSPTFLEVEYEDS